jgi:branched-chain amino acid transport system permease protein
VQQFINGLALGSTYALLGVGVTLVWGVLHVLTFVQTQVMAVGAFGTLIALNAGWPVPLAILAGVVAAALLSGAIDIAFFTPLRVRHAPEFAYVVITIGVAQVLNGIMAQKTDNQTYSFPRQGFPVEPLTVFGQNVPRLPLAMLIVSVVAMLALGYWLQRTRSGMAVRAVAYSRETSELLGINSRRVFAVCFMVSGGLSAIGAIFLAASAASMSYSSFEPLLLSAFAVIVLGGMGSVRGAVVGGLLLGLVSVYATVYVSPVFSEAVSMGTILLVLLIRPSGLFGEKASARV